MMEHYIIAKGPFQWNLFQSLQPQARRLITQDTSITRVQQPMFVMLFLTMHPRLVSTPLCSSRPSCLWSHTSLSHHVSAEEADSDHEQPARNNVEEPEHISERHSQAILSKRTIKWMEPSLSRCLILPCLGGVEISEELDIDSRSVQSPRANIDWSRRRSHLHDP